MEKELELTPNQQQLIDCAKLMCRLIELSQYEEFEFDLEWSNEPFDCWVRINLHFATEGDKYQSSITFEDDTTKGIEKQLIEKVNRAKKFLNKTFD